MSIERRFVIGADRDSLSGGFETREAAIQHCLTIFKDQESFFVGEKVNHKASDFFDVHQFLDSIGESAYLQYELDWDGEHTRESVESLGGKISRILDDWASETNSEPPGYRVTKIIIYRKVGDGAEEIKS